MTACPRCGLPRTYGLREACPACGHVRTGQRGSTRVWRELRRRRIADARRAGALRCKHCATALSGGRDTHLDHRQPKEAGGSDHPANLDLTCSRCNLAKGSS